MIGRVVRDRLPGELSDASKDLVRVAIGFIATLAALVLGLMISSAKDSFDARVDEVQRDPSALARPVGTDSADEIAEVQDALRAIKPGDEEQAIARSRAIQLTDELALMRWELAAHASGKIPPLAIVVRVVWCAAIVDGLNLFAPRDRMMRAVSATIALAIASAILLVLEMDDAFGGIIAVSDAPLRAAVQVLQR